MLALPRELEAGATRSKLHPRRGGDVTSGGPSGVDEVPGLTAVVEVLPDVSQIPPDGA